MEFETIYDFITKNNIEDGIYDVNINGVPLSIELYNFYNPVTYETSPILGNNTPDSTMLILKYHSNLTINENVVIKPQVRKKGFTIFCNGILTNNGSIDMTSRGAIAEGQNVYLMKNDDGTLEYVPAEGGAGGSGKYYGSQINLYGDKGVDGINRQSGGGGGGGGHVGGYSRSARTGNGAAGTSYSGGTGGGGAVAWTGGNAVAGNGSINGGRGGNASVTGGGNAGGGAGNPCGTSYSATKGTDGTGGLLIIYSKIIYNHGKISSNGCSAPYATSNGWGAGGSSGGGSVNIFVQSIANDGTIEANGGAATSGGRGAKGGNGSITINSMSNIALNIKKLFKINDKFYTYSNNNFIEIDSKNNFMKDLNGFGTTETFIDLNKISKEKDIIFNRYKEKDIFYSSIIEKDFERIYYDNKKFSYEYDQYLDISKLKNFEIFKNIDPIDSENIKIDESYLFLICLNDLIYTIKDNELFQICLLKNLNEFYFLNYGFELEKINNIKIKGNFILFAYKIDDVYNN